MWEVYPLKCPYCTDEMKIISFINEPDVIRKILEHLDLWNTQGQPRLQPERRFKPPQHNPCPAIIEQDDFDFFDDGRSGYEEPYITRDCQPPPWICHDHKIALGRSAGLLLQKTCASSARFYSMASG